MATHSLPRVSYDGRLMTEDAAAQGLDPKKLARRTRGRVSQRTVYRFLSGEVQTTQTAIVLAGVLGHEVGRYLISSSAKGAA